MALVGYARVSSIGQSLEVQLDKLKHCNKIFQEKKSAAGGKRPALESCLEYVREEDTLVVTRPTGALDAASVPDRRRTKTKRR